MPNKFFASHDEFSEIIEKTIKTFSEDKHDQDITRTFHPDDLTGCGRKLIYKTSSKNYKLVFDNMEYCTSQFAKVKWIHILQLVNGIRVIDKWVQASDGHFNMHTKIDCIIEVIDLDNTQFVVYVKSLPSNKFDDIKNSAHRKDILRVVADMWLIELNHGLIIYENRDTSDFLIYNIRPHMAIVNGLKDKAKELYSYKMNGGVPPRPYKTNSSKECQECEFFKTCWA